MNIRGNIEVLERIKVKYLNHLHQIVCPNTGIGCTQACIHYSCPVIVRDSISNSKVFKPSNCKQHGVILNIRIGKLLNKAIQEG